MKKNIHKKEKLMIFNKLLFLSIFFLFSPASLHAQQKLVINNAEPRRDMNGDIVDAHDGRVIQFGNRFYWYGTSYGNTNGFVRTNYYSCYSSANLKDWKKESRLLINEPAGVYYRPHVVYNKKTKKYILWYNWYPTLWQGKFGVAISDKPVGPFTIVNSDVQVKYSSMGVGDFSIYIDDDNAAYLAYNTIEAHSGSIEKLNDDYLSSSMENGGFITKGVEAGGMFKRNGKYYLLTDNTCCFCTQGSGARVYTSDKPISGYQFQNNINRYPGTIKPLLIDGRKNDNLYETLKKRTDSSFYPIQIKFSGQKEINKIRVSIFDGNRVGICGDTLAKSLHPAIVPPKFEVYKRKGTGWEKIRAFNKLEYQGPFSTAIIISFSSMQASDIHLRIEKGYPYTEIFITEVELYQNQQMVSAPGTNTMAFINDIDPAAATPIIPAQQTYIMPIAINGKMKFIWMGDLWGSATDNIKGHDFQFWSEPLVFDEDGIIEQLKWSDMIQLK